MEDLNLIFYPEIIMPMVVLPFMLGTAWQYFSSTHTPLKTVVFWVTEIGLLLLAGFLWHVAYLKAVLY
jgi:hypothetical protein